MQGDKRSDPLLFTPGPLTTSASVKHAMQRDVGSRDSDFIEVNKRIRDTLLTLADAQGSHVCIPIQGSGTYAVEAMLGSVLNRENKILVLVNGAYGERICTICNYLEIPYQELKSPEDTPPDVNKIEAILASDSAITHVVMVYCETTTGILNPLLQIADITAQQGRRLLIDAMSAFGALPLSAKEVKFEALAASSNKCLQGVPGVGFCIIEQNTLHSCRGNAGSLSLDLYEQWQGLEKNGQWRFTPPTQVLLALERALDELAAEGGITGRYKRYSENMQSLLTGMRQLGFQSYLADEYQAPVITTFLVPGDPAFNFQAFYNALRDRGFVIYPGKLTQADTFRIGCIGDIYADDIKALVAAIQSTLDEMGVKQCRP